MRDDDALKERVTFIHERFKTDAIVEEFIAGRELYIGVMGNSPPMALPPIEMVFGNESNVESRIATFKAKWSVRYRESRGIQNTVAKNLSSRSAGSGWPRWRCARFEAAGLRDYGRIDVRLAHDDAIYVVEANPNPYLAEGEDLAWAAEEADTCIQISSKKLLRWRSAATPRATDSRARFFSGCIIPA